MSFLRRLLGRKPSKHRLYWLTSDLAIAGEPGDTELAALRAAGVRAVVDLRAEAPDRGASVAAYDLRYLRLPVVEGEAPGTDELRLLTSWIVERIQSDGPVLVHCREGRGRSAMVACAALVSLGLPLFNAYQALSRARPDVALNGAQADALLAFAEGRDDLTPRG
jgi:protein tyrosine phosphatase (PTP) superfamily phosphohydrolase (DUF442 family)